MDECAWREGDGHWCTDCHHEFVVNEGTPSENGMKYCCFCSKQLVEFPEERDKS